MIIHDVQQGSDEWIKLRLGLPTSSEFDRIVTPGGKPSSSEARRKYAFWLATERIFQRQLSSIDHLEHVANGKIREPIAASAYEFVEEVETKPVGFITSDDGRLGASPDRLIVGKNAGLEIKSPAPWTMMQYIVDGFGKAYMVQAQGQIYVCRFDYVDRYAWNPETPPVLNRTPSDKDWQALLHDNLTRFCDELDEIVERARAAGTFCAGVPQTSWDSYMRDLEKRGRYLDAG